MIIISILLTLFFLFYLSVYDYRRFKEKDSTGRLSLIIRTGMVLAFTLIDKGEFGNIWISLGFNVFLNWWIWDSFCGFLWYRDPMATGTTKWVDNLLKPIPAPLLWWIKFIGTVSFVSYYINEMYLMTSYV